MKSFYEPHTSPDVPLHSEQKLNLLFPDFYPLEIWQVSWVLERSHPICSLSFLTMEDL